MAWPVAAPVASLSDPTATPTMAISPVPVPFAAPIAVLSVLVAIIPPDADAVAGDVDEAVKAASVSSPSAVPVAFGRLAVTFPFASSPPVAVAEASTADTAVPPAAELMPVPDAVAAVSMADATPAGVSEADPVAADVAMPSDGLPAAMTVSDPVDAPVVAPSAVETEPVGLAAAIPEELPIAAFNVTMSVPYAPTNAEAVVVAACTVADDSPAATF